MLSNNGEQVERACAVICRAYIAHNLQILADKINIFLERYCIICNAYIGAAHIAHNPQQLGVEIKHWRINQQTTTSSILPSPLTKYPLVERISADNWGW